MSLPDEIYISASGRVYKPDDVFSSNHDGDLLARDAWECKRYVRADQSALAERDKRIEALEGALRLVQSAMKSGRISDQCLINTKTGEIYTVGQTVDAALQGDEGGK